MTGGKSDLLLQAEPVGARRQRSEQQLIEQHDDHDHRGNGPADGAEILALDGEGDVGADARQCDGGIADADGL